MSGQKLRVLTNQHLDLKKGKWLERELRSWGTDDAPGWLLCDSPRPTTRESPRAASAWHTHGGLIECTSSWNVKRIIAPSLMAPLVDPAELIVDTQTSKPSPFSLNACVDPAMVNSAEPFEMQRTQVVRRFITWGFYRIPKASGRFKAYRVQLNPISNREVRC